MKKEKLLDLLEAFPPLSIVIVGDFCLDAYLVLDRSASEISVETGLPTYAVAESRYTLGGAGNVAANCRSLGVGSVSAVGVIGDDLYGGKMLEIMDSLGIDRSAIVRQSGRWHTNVYTKLYDDGQELNRIDFGNFNSLSDVTEEKLVAALKERVAGIESSRGCVIINQQTLSGIYTPSFRRHLTELVAAHRQTRFFLDSRQMTEGFDGAIRKLNDREGASVCGREFEGHLCDADAREVAAELNRKWKTPVFLTRGERGCVVADDESIEFVPGLHILSKIDSVGAGDSFLAAAAAAVSAGATPYVAAQVGNFASGVTVQKLLQTGTAGKEEILKIGTDPDYRYNVEIASGRRESRYSKVGGFEILDLNPDDGPFDRPPTHIIFDHDGTISTLREGWEKLMEPIMVRAVLGEDRRASGKVRREVEERVRSYIAKTTGIQTLSQMFGLVELVREFGIVPESEMLDAAGYKEVYNREILDMVAGRLKRLACGELDLADFTVKGSVQFLRELVSRGVRLYLASGTDTSDVIREAETLGYADCFEGRIYGAVGDITYEPKKIVIDKILDEIGSTYAQTVFTFGDGPVEIRETRKRGGTAIGIASDEVRRHGWNPAKRSRLVEAGASLLIPDFSSYRDLLNVMFGS